MKNYKAYIFDFDGTLFDSYFSMIDIFDKSFESIGQTCTHDETKHYMRGSLQAVIKERNIEGEEHSTFVDSIMKYLDDKETTSKTVPYDETVEILTKLYKNSAKLGIVTGNNVPHVEELLSSYNLREMFDAIVGSDNCSIPKPNAEPLLMAMSMMPGFSKEEVCYIGDSINDYQCAVNAGVDGYLLDRDNEYNDFTGPKIHNLGELIINL